MKNKIKSASFSVIISLIIIMMIHIFIPLEEDYTNVTFKVYSSLDISEGSLASGAAQFEAKYNCNVTFSSDPTDCDLIYSSGEDFSNCLPLDKLINKRNPLYTKFIIDTACTDDSKIYGITNVLLGNINYCMYYPDQFRDTPIPYEYFKKKDWNWNSFIDMTTDLNSNIAIDWSKSYINMKNALIPQKDGSTVFDYGSQDQIEWLNFVRTLIYDKGIVDNSEGALKIGFLPEMLLNESDISAIRFIPLPTKSGSLPDAFVDEYHFCVPKDAKNPKGSVILADYMIKSCKDTRLNLYQSSMAKEDFKIFKKQLKKIYVYPKHTDYVPAELFINDFIHGKTVTEHIYNIENQANHIK